MTSLRCLCSTVWFIRNRTGRKKMEFDSSNEKKTFFYLWNLSNLVRNYLFFL